MKKKKKLQFINVYLLFNTCLDLDDLHNYIIPHVLK